jgi:aryl-alcohol dehydrogenase-like predicted oxidoreductase
LLNFKRLGLGTVQWGMMYGIANEKGIASKITVKNILNKAKENGVDLLDTANVYGNAESVLGIHNVIDDGFNVVTKTQSLGSLTNSRGTLVDGVEEAFYQSLSKLGANNIYGLLVHHAEDLLGDTGDALWSWLSKISSEGLVKKIGCSVYEPAQLHMLLDRYDLELVQLPYNIYDQSYITSGVAEDVKKKGIEVHARSSFLQGLLLIQPDELPVYFKELYSHHKALWNEYNSLDLKPVEAALGFSLSCNYIDKVIVGCEQLQQWEEIISAAKKNITPNIIKSFQKFAIDDVSYINPSKWKT